MVNSVVSDSSASTGNGSPNPRSPSPDDIIALAASCGYEQYRPSTSSTLYFAERPSRGQQQQQRPGSKPIKINVYYTTRSLMTYLDHPTQGTNMMWRSSAYETLDDLREFFVNPRTHTGRGYRRSGDARRGCAGCGELKLRGEFSNNQWKTLGPDRNRCRECVASGVGVGVGRPAAKPEDESVAGLEEDFVKLELTQDALRLHDGIIKREGGSNKEGAGLPNNDLERRQFNCPDCPRHGRGPHVFFKRVPKMRPVCKCPKCKRATRGKCNRLFAVPRDEERGYGLYRCDRCNDKWGSSRAVGGIGQECFTCLEVHGRSHVMVKPFRIEIPRRKKAGERRVRVPRDPIREDEAEELGYGESDRRRNDAEGLLANPSSTYDYEPTSESESESGRNLLGKSSKPEGYRHRCSGCATGTCRNRRVPKSLVHESDGDTASTRSSVVTNSSVDKSDFLDRDDDFRAFEVED